MNDPNGKRYLLPHFIILCGGRGGRQGKFLYILKMKLFYRPQYVLYFAADLLTVDFCALKHFSSPKQNH
jgi:hypothetical protein